MLFVGVSVVVQLWPRVGSAVAVRTRGEGAGGLVPEPRSCQRRSSADSKVLTSPEWAFPRDAALLPVWSHVE